MNQVLKMSLLLDFYGQLLTDRQLMIMDLHYNNDLSLAEIAEQLGISRQGVYENIKRARAVLAENENKLGLVKRFLDQKTELERLMECLEKTESECADKMGVSMPDSFYEAKSIVQRLIES